MFPSGINTEFSNNSITNPQMYQQVNTQGQLAMNVQTTPYLISMSQPAPTKPMPPNLYPPLPQTQIPLVPITYHSSASNYQLQRLPSTSEEEEENNEPASSNDWQEIRSSKRRKIRKTTDNANSTNIIVTENRFEALENEVIPPKENNTANPPPIFIHGVQDYQKWYKKLRM